MRWFELEDLLRKEIGNLTDPISSFLAKELLGFWREEKNMYLDKVESGLKDELAIIRATRNPDNLPSLRNLFFMLEAIAGSLFLHTQNKWKVGKKMIRIRLWDTDGRRKGSNRLGTLALYYNSPNDLELEFAVGEYSVAVPHAKELRFQFARNRWYMGKVLKPEFFGLEKSEQRRHLEVFIKQCADAAKELREKSKAAS